VHPTSVRDIRICAIGDSFVAGVGDPECRGWVGRLAADGPPVTLYNLGVRRETSRDVLARWRREVVPRLPEGVEGRVVLSLGVNDTTVENGATRVPADESVANLRAILDGLDVPTLVVGPPPVADEEQNVRIADLSSRFADVCRDYVPVVDALRADDVWMDEVRSGDGAHPGATGYRRLADLVAPVWSLWLMR
jgi:acyl-CoA thioesterase I